MTTRKIMLLIIAVLAIGAILRLIQIELTKRQIKNTSVETDTFLGYVLTKDDKHFIVRCDKSLWDRLKNRQNYDTRISITSNVRSSKNDLPSSDENKKFFKIEDMIIQDVLKDNEKHVVFAGVVTGGGRKEYFLYTTDRKKGEELLPQLQRSFPEYRFTVTVKSDNAWQYYQAYCQKKSFPQ